MEGIVGIIYDDDGFKIKIDEPLKHRLILLGSSLIDQFENCSLDDKTLMEFFEIHYHILSYCEKTYGVNFSENWTEIYDSLKKSDLDKKIDM